MIVMVLILLMFILSPFVALLSKIGIWGVIAIVLILCVIGSRDDK